MLTDEEADNILAIGNSGTDFARRINPDARSQAVETVKFAREREQRQLECERIVLEKPPVLVDDVVVSGQTLGVAKNQINPSPSTAVVGMLFRSKRTKRRTGLQDLRPGVVYTREGGGSPPMNSISSLQKYPDRLNELSTRYFSLCEEGFKSAVLGDQSC